LVFQKGGGDGLLVSKGGMASGPLGLVASLFRRSKFKTPKQGFLSIFQGREAAAPFFFLAREGRVLFFWFPEGGGCREDGFFRFRFFLSFSPKISSAPMVVKFFSPSSAAL
jgi:hypothetical protein